jgi:hypothetical protein
LQHEIYGKSLTEEEAKLQKNFGAVEGIIGVVGVVVSLRFGIAGIFFPTIYIAGDGACVLGLGLRGEKVTPGTAFLTILAAQAGHTGPFPWLKREEDTK